MRVLVTGGSGFLGRYVVKELIDAGFKVRGTYHSIHKKRVIEELGAEPVRMSLENQETYGPALEGVDVVIHLAAYYTFTGKRELYQKLNVEATEKLALAALKRRATRFIYCSSTEAMGPVESPPGSEETPPNPQNEYGKSKLLAEKKIIEIAKQGLKYTIIRPSGLYGPGNIDDVSYWFITGYARRGLPSKIMIGKGHTYIQFAHAKDAAVGFRLAVEREESINQIFIITEDRFYTYREVYEILYKITGVEPPRISINPRIAKFLLFFTEIYDKFTGEGNIMYRRMIVDSVTKHRAYSNEKAKRLLGFKPTYNLEDGLRETIRWYRENGYI